MAAVRRHKHREAHLRHQHDRLRRRQARRGIARSSWSRRGLVADRRGIADWALVFQSRCRRREDPWLEPNICQYPRAERARSRAAAVICPIGFGLR